VNSGCSRFSPPHANRGGGEGCSTSRQRSGCIRTSGRAPRQDTTEKINQYILLVGLGRACAPVRYAHPSFWAHCHAQRGAARPPTHRSFAAPPKIKNKLFPEIKCLPLGPNSARQWRIFFHWAKLHPIELYYILLSYAAPYRAMLHPNKQCCIQLSYATPNLS
jgi:hypothetical protein